MKYHFSEIISLNSFEEMMQAFFEISSLTYELIDSEGKCISKSQTPSICELFDLHANCQKTCIKKNSDIKIDIQYQEYSCPNGFSVVFIPVVVEKEHIASLYLRHFFYEKPKISDFEKRAKALKVDKNEFKKAVKEIPVINADKLHSLLKLFTQSLKMLISSRLDGLRSQKISEVLWAGERAVTAELKFHQALIETIPNPIFYTNEEGIYIGCNSAFEEYTGRYKKDIIGNVLYDIVPEEFADIFANKGQNLAKQKGIRIYEENIKLPNGDMRDILFYTAVIKNSKSEFGGLVGVMLDISEQKQMEKRIREDLNRKKKNLEKAQHRQKHLNPVTLPVVNTISIRSLFMPSEGLGGDFFDIRKTPKGKIIVLLGDCTGHGIESALDATLMKAIVDRHIWLLEKTDATDAFLEDVNKDMMIYSSKEEYPTLFVCQIDPKTNDVYYSNANGELPYIVNNGVVKRFEKVQGFHIGFDENTEYKKKHIRLKEDDIIILFSDALIEATNEKGELVFTNKLVEKALLDFGEGIKGDMQKLLEKLEKKVPKFPLDDDLTLIFLQKVKSEEDMYIISNYNELENLRTMLEEKMQKLNYDSEDIIQASVALHEIGTNAIYHGNKENFDRKLIVNLRLNCSKIEVSIEDEGEGFNLLDVRDPTDFSKTLKLIQEGKEEEFTHGRGIWLVTQYVEDLIYNEKGNKATFSKKRSKLRTDFRYFTSD